MSKEKNNDQTVENKVVIVDNDNQKKVFDLSKPIHQLASEMPNASTLMNFAASTAQFQMRYDKELKEDFGEAYRASIRNVSIMNVLAMAQYQEELRQLNEAGVETKIVLSGSLADMDNLRGQARMLGINIKSVKELPAPEGSEDGQQSFEFNQDSVEIQNEELKSEMEKEAANKTKKRKEKVIPELDPVKIGTDEKMLKDALVYITDVNQNGGFAKTIDGAIEWYRNYLSQNHLFKAGESNEDIAENIRIAKETSKPEILRMLFNVFKPTAIFTGTGSVAYISAKRLGTVIPVHCLFMKEGKALWSHEEIADFAKLFIELKADSIIKAAAKTTVATEAQAAEGAKAEIIPVVTSIAEDDAMKTLISIPSVEEIERFVAADKEDIAAIEVKGRLHGALFPKDWPRDNDSYKNDIRNAMGVIVNLYASPENRLSEFENLDPKDILRHRTVKDLEQERQKREEASKAKKEEETNKK